MDKEEFYNPVGGFKGKVRFLPPFEKKEYNIVYVDYPSTIGRKSNYDNISRYMNEIHKLQKQYRIKSNRIDKINKIFLNEIFNI